MKTALIVIIFAAILWLIAAFICFLVAQLRANLPDYRNRRVLEHSQHRRFAAVITEGITWTLAQDTVPHELRAYDGVRLHAELLENPGAKRLVILMHGWRSTPVTDFAGAVRFYREHGCHVLMVSQRAHGKSGGAFLTFGVRERYDCKLWAEYMSRLYPECSILLEGMSMGAATVLMAAGLELPKQVRGIVADCGYTSPGDIVAEVIRSVFGRRVRPLERTMELFSRIFAGTGYSDCCTQDALRGCSIPVMLAHGRADSFVPCRMSEENHAAHGGDCELHLVDGAGHGESALVEPERIYGALEAFMDRVL